MTANNLDTQTDQSETRTRREALKEWVLRDLGIGDQSDRVPDTIGQHTPLGDEDWPQRINMDFDGFDRILIEYDGVEHEVIERDGKLEIVEVDDAE